MMTDVRPTPRTPVLFEDLQRLPPGRHRVPTEEVARQQRERLMAGMLYAVGEQGYVATSVADVLARAGVSRRTFYEHFTDKEDCFLQAFDHVAERLTAAVRETVEDAAGDWRAAARAGLALLLQTVAEHPRYARAAIVEVLAVGTEGMRHRDAALDPFKRFFEAARADVGATHLPDTVAETLVGGILETITARVMRGQADQVPALLDDLVFWALVPFVGPVDAADAMHDAPRVGA